MKKRIVIAAIVQLVVLLGAWLAGFDFNERGFKAFFVYVISVYLSVSAFVLTGDEP